MQVRETTCAEGVAHRVSVCVMLSPYTDDFAGQFFKKITYLFFRGRGGKGEREGVKHQCERGT